MARTLRFEVEYPHPPERVWAAITSSEAIAKWLMQNDFEPVLGRRFQLRAKPVPGWSGVVDCEVTELAPPRRMVWRWASDWIETTLTFDLVPVPGGTRLVLVHDGFSGLRGHVASWMMGGGWKGILRDRLRDVLEGRTPRKAC